jgi:integrase
MADFLDDKFCGNAEGPGEPEPGKPQKAYLIHYDSQTKGFGLRVTRASAKSFILTYRNRGGQDRRYTIGTFKDPWKTKAARTEAMRLKALIDQGEDPQGDKTEIRAAPTINDLIERWREEHAPEKRERSRIEDERLIKQWLKPELGTAKVADLRFADISALHRKITKQGTPYRANRALALLSKMLSLAVQWEMRADNPARGVKRNSEEPRYRYLDPDELARLIAALDLHPDRNAANAIRVLLLTGARTAEALNAAWSQFDLRAGTWTKPSSHTKTKREHRVPLSPQARELLAKMFETKTSPLLFPQVQNLRHDWAALCKAAKLSGVRIHDLRHSYASVLASAGLSLPIIGALLGHTTPTTTARYAHLLDAPLREATEKASVIILKTGASSRS